MGKAMRAKIKIRPSSTTPSSPDGMVTLPADIHTMDFLRHHLDFNATWSAPIDGNTFYAILSALLELTIFDVRKHFWYYCDAAKKTHKLDYTLARRQAGRTSSKRSRRGSSPME